jgi:hypothetical protein
MLIDLNVILVYFLPCFIIYFKILWIKNITLLNISIINMQ